MNRNSSLNTLLGLLLALFTFASGPVAAEPFWQWDTLAGNWGGFRQKLADKGVNFEFVYTADVYANVSGGVSRGGEYLDHIDLVLNIDAEKLINWPGASFMIYGIGTQGGSPSWRAGDAQAMSNIDAPDFWRLHMAWYQQEFADGRISFLFGLYDINMEYDTSETGSVFINSSHGIGPDFSQSGLNGPSLWPYSSLAARLKVFLTPEMYVQAAVMDGVPGNPNDPESNPIRFDSGDGFLVAAETGFITNAQDEDKPYGKFALGTWIYTADFDDLEDVDAGGNPVRSDNNMGFYALGEYTVYREREDKAQGLALFGRIGLANQDINQFGYYVGGGAVYTGLFPRRDEDKFGLGIAAAINGTTFKRVQSATGAPVDRAEIAVELTYKAQLTPWLAVQPDVQYIFNPSTDPTISNALSIGTRFEISL